MDALIWLYCGTHSECTLLEFRLWILELLWTPQCRPSGFLMCTAASPVRQFPTRPSPVDQTRINHFSLFVSVCNFLWLIFSWLAAARRLDNHFNHNFNNKLANFSGPLLKNFSIRKSSQSVHYSDLINRNLRLDHKIGLLKLDKILKQIFSSVFSDCPF